jgi:hypothetical protein
MRNKRFCLVLLAAGVVAAACASSAATYNPNVQYGYPVTAAPATMGPAVPAASAAGPVDLAGSTPVFGQGQSGEGNPTAAPAGTGLNATGPESQIVKTGTISIQVAAVDTSIAHATDLMHGFGGWLAGSDRTTGAAQEVASVTYRIPVARFEDALAAMRTLGTKVLSEHTESTAVGGQIVDLQARIANLRASEKAIQAIMAKANTIGDVLTVQQRLADVQGQIEELSGQLAGLTDQAAYSTLTVVFVVPVVPTPTPSPSPTPTPSATATPIPWSAGDQAGQAAGDLGEVGKAAATLIIWAAILVLPIALVLILLLALLAVVARALEPLRKRLMPYTGAPPGTWAAPAPASGPPPAGAPGPRPEEGPKA